MFRISAFEKLLEKATSNLHLDPDWPAILQICDLIRQGDIQPKAALAAIKKKIINPNPHVAFFGLLVLESCVKNCGSPIHDEIGTKQYMEQLKELVKTSPHDNVKLKTLELIQAWAFAFRNSPKYRAVQDTVNIMKAEGYNFPALKESDAMFSADTAPEWAQGEVCHRCRVAFGVIQRRHHCRACGQVFCQQCSSKVSTLPKFGIEKEVRVCEACYEQVNKPSTASTKETDLPAEYLTSSLAQQQQMPPRKTAEELQEEEELHLAIALSQSEAEQKEKEKKRATSAVKTSSSPIARTTHSPTLSPNASPSRVRDEESDNPELAKYLNRKYWEQRQSMIEEHSSRPDVTSPSAPNIGSPMPQRIMVPKQQNGEVDNEMEEFVSNLRSQVEIFVNRMKSNSSRGRSIANDSFFQALFMNITAMHSKLLRYIQEHDDNRVCYEGLQDKLAQMKDARAALDALREEHRDKLRREAEEAERQRQLQMAHKLDIMRKKKQEYLQYTRQLALQKIQEQERELQMRQEHQKQQYIMGSYQTVPTFIGPVTHSSPIRHPHYQAPGPTYNPMSPTNQGVYVYGPPSVGPYQMQNYGMSQMSGVPPHMINSLANPEQQGSTEPTAQNRDSMPPTGPGMANQLGSGPMSQMQQASAHQMGQQVQQQAPVHMTSGRPMPQTSGPTVPTMGPPPTSVPQHVLPMRPTGPMPLSQVPPSAASQIGAQQSQNPLVMQQSMPPIQQHNSAPNIPPNASSLPMPSPNVSNGGGPPSQAVQHHQALPGQQQIPIPQVQSVQYQPPSANQPQVASQPQTSTDSNETKDSAKPDTAELISFD
ncbi:hepatocyte growth factor-regulated tyrosine kinase substrate [Venturia canescens]|uniref:hepatocyte growth factor-regulated tyrosine kinase substrate n=1 Tax=Venturia canescens TaxID=32260 RepID=UPI001C9D038A|nr:hepatocyte growth factor-regulated tyrosine kinase substrate [Venturia canescens]